MANEPQLIDKLRGALDALDGLDDLLEEFPVDYEPVEIQVRHVEQLRLFIIYELSQRERALLAKLQENESV